jgi:hypothetical protein
MATPTKAELLAQIEAQIANIVEPGQITKINMAAVLANMVAYSVVQTVKATLTAAQIKTLQSAPVELIPAPGAGKAIKILHGAARFNYGTVPFDDYTIFSTLLLQLDTAGLWQTETGNGFLNLEEDVFSAIPGATFSNEAPGNIVENKALMATAKEDSGVTGDSTIDVYLTYEIFDI